ncbi:MAG: peptidylprolyl isomerase [Bacillota bacterium]
MKKFIAVLLLIALTLSLAACGGKDGQGSDLVKVGDTAINESKLEKYLEFTAFIQNIDLTQFPEESMKVIKAQMLEDLISLEAIRQHYAGKEKEVLPATIEEDLKSFLDEAKKEESVNTFLKEKKITDDILTEFFYDQYYRNAYLEEVEAGMPNLEADAKAYYEDNKESYKVDEVTASHILVEKEELAKEILAKLNAGEKFEDLAKQYGTDGTKDTGGSLGTFGRGRMIKEFEDVVFAMKPGETSDVVKTEFGYHILRVTDKNQGTKTSDEVKDSIISDLVSQEAEKQTKELKDSIGVEYLTKEYTEPTEETETE